MWKDQELDGAGKVLVSDDLGEHQHSPRWLSLLQPNHTAPPTVSPLAQMPAGKRAGAGGKQLGTLEE